MQPNFKSFFQAYSQLFWENELAPIVKTYDLPTAIYIDQRLMVLRKADDVKNALTTYRQALVDAGGQSTQHKIVAQSTIAKSHLSVWVEWTHYNGRNNVISCNTSRVYCSLDAGNISKIQIIEFLKAPPEAHIENLPLIPA